MRPYWSCDWSCPAFARIWRAYGVRLGEYGRISNKRLQNGYNLVTNSYKTVTNGYKVMTKSPKSYKKVTKNAKKLQKNDKIVTKR